MNVDRFIAEHSPSWLELERLVGRARHRADRLGAAEAIALGTRYRSAAADLATARRRYPGQPVVDRLEPLVESARQLVYAGTPRRTSLLWWLTTGYWRRVRERPAALLAAAALLLVPLVGAGAWAHADPVRAGQAATVNDVTRRAAESPATGARGFSTGESAALSSQVFTNNIRVALLCFATGITGGIGTALLLLYNGFTTGLLAGLSTALGRGDVFVRLVVPHGLLELSLIIVAGTAGLRVGWAIVAPGHRPRADALATEARAAAELALGCAIWLVPCGIVEGFVTPKALPLPAALAVGASLAALFWGLVLWRGRPPVPAAVDDLEGRDGAHGADDRREGSTPARRAVAAGALVAALALLAACGGDDPTVEATGAPTTADQTTAAPSTSPPGTTAGELRPPSSAPDITGPIASVALLDSRVMGCPPPTGGTEGPDSPVSDGSTGCAPSDPDLLGTVTIRRGTGQVDAATIAVRTGTRILRPTAAGGWDTAGVDDLAQGQAIEVWFSGPVAESYPVQATAATIAITS